MKILQIGFNDWSKLYKLNDELEWFFFDPTAEGVFDVSTVSGFNAVLVDAFCELDVFESLEPLINPYTFIVNEYLKEAFDDRYDEFFKKKMVIYENMTKHQELIDLLPKKYFSNQFGQKLPVRKNLFSPLHTDKVWFEGTKYNTTNISYGDKFRQLLFWKLSIPYDNQYDLELWPEYKIDEGCSLEFDMQFVQSGSSDEILFQKRYSEEELKSPILFSNSSNGYLICSVFVKGNGLIRIGPVHYRNSRLGAGEFLPGGKRLCDTNRQELFYYFHPGNLKPPFSVYFSCYRPEEGFEGYSVIKSFGHPFLLITDPRLEVGSFYVGSNDLENQLAEIIRKYIDILGFEEEDVIFSGLAMGSFGALYYGSKFKAHSIIVCKPIVDVDYVAERTRLVRPYDFLTSLDIVKYCDKTDDDGNPVSMKESYEELLKRWSEGEGFGDTKLVIAHMEQDDIDDQAYFNIINTQAGKQTTIIAKGYQGRHNDENTKIVDWFVNQYNRVIKEYKEAKNEL